MPGKTKDNTDKAQVLKGQEAEDAILSYLKKMNRPFGAVDVAANLKGAVPKSTTQKILATLAEKGEITQKPYGKTVFYVAKQSDLEDIPPEKLADLESEYKDLEEDIRGLQEDVKRANSELNKLKGTPTDEDLDAQLKDINNAVQKTLNYLNPLRTGTSTLLTADEMDKLDSKWTNWRAEWIKRHRIYNNLWHIISDSIPPQAADELKEELGIEEDTDEHHDIERGPLCSSIPSKRR
ncbi:TBPIP-domain-containing [Pyrrhoderma noxium]|uniref:TBPIP-domain-containing n=1 Tax=Pyrrhoderma noxium TaxID=2282107 RepID=A0A286UUT2_9AGAM|nr:TBPIP-domain-containing [Pyrrhoderma noxium]